jgi:NAD(P)-dependent dehydrogenase (short-subunit alcohol dehydrogenase family)
MTEQHPATFAGRTAVVTGGSRSIGRAIAVGLAAAGANVVLNYRHDRAAADATLTEIRAAGGSAEAVRADISTAAGAHALVEQAVDVYGPVHHLVNNAAVIHRTGLLDIELDEWDEVIRTNLTGSFLTTQAVARAMVDAGTSGSVVTISSINNQYARPGLTHYSASKAGVTMMTRQVALELASHGIRANTVALGLFETDMNRERLSDPATRDHYLEQIPLGVLGQPQDAVGPVLFLLSDAARMITGATLTVDAGRSLA